MRIVFFIPALRKLTGGLTNIYTVAHNLQSIGFDVALMGLDPLAAGLSRAKEEGLAILPWGSPLTHSDVWCIPESWPNSLAVGVDAGATVLVYVQNWVYMLGNLPEDIRWSSLPLQYVAVSSPVRWFMREVLGLTVMDELLPPVIQDSFFSAPNRPEGRVRVGLMPRKNAPQAQQIRYITSAYLAERPHAPRVEWVSIHNVSQSEVAEQLRTCHFYLSTGFPEGFGLPPLEAMASGCIPVGFAGGGGWDYMRQAKVEGIENTFSFQFAEPDPSTCLQGNGFFYADGDTLGTGVALAKAILLSQREPEKWDCIRESCRCTAERYTMQHQRDALAAIFTVEP